MKVSLGLLEVKGLALAINTADAMAKCAAINMVGIDTAKGGGWMTIKVTGDVAAVQAAVATGAALAEQSNGFVAQKVLSRPDAKLLATVVPQEKPAPIADTEAATEPESTKEEQSEQEDEDPEPDAVLQQDESESESESSLAADIEEAQEQTPLAESDEPSSEQEKPPIATCNLCQDPACPRKKGEPHVDCIHEGRNK